MAFDFSNRDPSDPHGVAQITPNAVPDAYLPAGAGDWSTYAVDPQDAAARGLTRSVALALVTLNNGDQYFAVQDEKDKPIDLIGDRKSVDDKQAARFKGAQSAAAPSSGQMTTRQMQPDGQYHIMGWDPNGAGPGKGAYTIDQGIAASPATTPHTEGTPIPGQKNPDGSQAYDNTKPVQVNRDVNGNQVGAAVPLTGEPLLNWERDQNEAANRGRFTNAELAARGQSATDRTPVKGRPGVYQVTTKDGAGNSTTHFENETGQTIATPTDVTATQAPDQSWGYWDTSGGSPVWKPIAGGPNAARTPVLINGQYGYWDQSSGSPVWKPIDSAPTGSGGFTSDRGAPPLNVTPGQVAAGLKARSDWLNNQVDLWKKTGGKEGMSPDDATKAMTRASELAQAVINEDTSLVNTQGSQRSQDITQRGNTLTDTASRRNAAQTAYSTVLNQYLPMTRYLAPGKGGDMAAAMQESLQNAIAYQNQYGGLKDTPEIGTSNFPALEQARQASMAAMPAPPPAPPPVVAAPPAPDAAAAAPAAAPDRTAPQPPAAVNPVSNQPIAAPPPVPNVPPTPPPATAGDFPDFPGMEGGASGPGVGNSPASFTGPDPSTLRVLPMPPSGVATYVGPDGTMYQQIGTTLQKVGQDPTAWAQAAGPTGPDAPNVAAPPDSGLQPGASVRPGGATVQVEPLPPGGPTGATVPTPLGPDTPGPLQQNPYGLPPTMTQPTNPFAPPDATNTPPIGMAQPGTGPFDGGANAPAFLASARGMPPLFDPHGHAAGLAQRLGIDPRIMAAAFQNHYGMPWQNNTTMLG